MNDDELPPYTPAAARSLASWRRDLDEWPPCRHCAGTGNEPEQQRWADDAYGLRRCTSCFGSGDQL